MVERILNTALMGTVVRLRERSSRETKAQIDAILADSGRAKDDRFFAAAVLIAGEHPDFEKYLRKEYEHVLDHLLKKGRDKREKDFESSEVAAETVGEAVQTAEDVSTLLGSEGPWLSTIGAANDLLFDPARFKRTPLERQKRLSKQLMGLGTKLVCGLWLGLASYTVADFLERQHVMGPLPARIKGLVPTWYSAGGLDHQAISLGLTAVVALVAMFVLGFVAAWLGSAGFLTPLFAVRVSDDELASNVLRNSLLPLFPEGVPADTLKSSCDTVYRTICMEHGRQNRDDLRILDELLRSGTERDAAAFVRSKVKSYKDVMQAEAADFSDKAAALLSFEEPAKGNGLGGK
jgi:hypothetical protein